MLRAGLWSRDGASFRLLELIRGRRVEPALSVPLVLEYEMVLKRQATELGLAPGDTDGILDFDELVLELAVAAGCRQIITFNGRDFAGSERLGVEVGTYSAPSRSVPSKPMRWSSASRAWSVDRWP